MSEQVTFNVDAPRPTGGEVDGVELAPGQASEAFEDKIGQPERPPWLPEKFKSPEDLAKSYAELERKLSARSQPEEPKPDGIKPEESKPEDPKPEQDPGELLSDEEVLKYTDEFRATGSLTEESFQALEKKGLPRYIVSAYLQNAKAAQDYAAHQVVQTVGGQEVFDAAMAWAADNLSEEEIAAYNDQMQSGNMASATIAVRGLVAMFREKTGYRSPSGRLASRPSPMPSNPGVFESNAQLIAAMQDPRYKTDPAYRQTVYDRLARSETV